MTSNDPPARARRARVLFLPLLFLAMLLPLTGFWWPRGVAPADEASVGFTLGSLLRVWLVPIGLPALLASGATWLGSGWNGLRQAGLFALGRPPSRDAASALRLVERSLIAASAAIALLGVVILSLHFRAQDGSPQARPDPAAFAGAIQFTLATPLIALLLGRIGAGSMADVAERELDRGPPPPRWRSDLGLLALLVPAAVCLAFLFIRSPEIQR